MDEPYSSDQFAVAIVGMAGRFPGARNIDEFWQNIRDGVESISFFTRQELEASGIDPQILNHQNYVRARGVLEAVEGFDPSFFGYSLEEAKIMDPQLRFLLECSWEAMENAGYAPTTTQGPVGVFVGSGLNTYFLNRLYRIQGSLEVLDPMQIMIASDRDFLATSISYRLNLQGPSLAVQTACSSSLVAVHLASQSLLSGESDLALAGGVSIPIPQKRGYFYKEGYLGSPDGHCRAFDLQAQGTVGSSGVGVVVLKRLGEALTDRDHIYGVIRGSAVNNDGHMKIGFTAPSIEGQANVVAEALAVSGVDPETVTYVEAHGIGTPLGDSVEIAALTRAFRLKTLKKGFCAIGSVETNIGHAGHASGMARLIKAAQMLTHKLLPPTLNFKCPNPEIDFDNSPFFVNSKLTEWKDSDAPRRAGISNIGIGGTNVHLIIEEAPMSLPTSEFRSWQMVMLSAQTDSALERATNNLVRHMREHPDLNLADVAYTLQIGRKDFNHRRLVVCRSLEDAIQVLDSRDPARMLTQVQESGQRKILFVFPGSETPDWRIFNDLYREESDFRAQVDECLHMLRATRGLNLISLFDTHLKQSSIAANNRLASQEVEIIRFVFEYALGMLWQAWGVHPDAVLGGGVGELVSASIAGVLTLEDSLAIAHGEPLSSGFVQQIGNVKSTSSEISYISSINGAQLLPGELSNSSYWLRYSQRKPQFESRIEQFLKDPGWSTFILGPFRDGKQVNGQMAFRTRDGRIAAPYTELIENEPVVRGLLQGFGKSWLAGASVNWGLFYAREWRQRVPLPTYAFERQRCWLEATESDSLSERGNYIDLI